MFERCIRYDRSFVPAYLGLSKLKSGISSGVLLKRALEVVPENHLVRLELADWLYSKRKYIRIKVKHLSLKLLPTTDLHIQALELYESAIQYENSFQLSFVTGALKALRSLGQRERMHQLILR